MISMVYYDPRQDAPSHDQGPEGLEVLLLVVVVVVCCCCCCCCLSVQRGSWRVAFGAGGAALPPILLSYRVIPPIVLPDQYNMSLIISFGRSRRFARGRSLTYSWLFHHWNLDQSSFSAAASSTIGMASSLRISSFQLGSSRPKKISLSKQAFMT